MWTCYSRFPVQFPFDLPQTFLVAKDLYTNVRENPVTYLTERKSGKNVIQGVERHRGDSNQQVGDCQIEQVQVKVASQFLLKAKSQQY